jgi:hypothetical protein
MYVQVRPKGKPAPIPKEDQPHKAGRSWNEFNWH